MVTQLSGKGKLYFLFLSLLFLPFFPFYSSYICASRFKASIAISHETSASRFTSGLIFMLSSHHKLARISRASSVTYVPQSRSRPTISHNFKKLFFEKRLTFTGFLPPIQTVCHLYYRLRLRLC